MALPYANLDTLHALKAEREIAELRRSLTALAHQLLATGQQQPSYQLRDKPEEVLRYDK